MYMRTVGSRQAVVVGMCGYALPGWGRDKGGLCMGRFLETGDVTTMTWRFCLVVFPCHGPIRSYRIISYRAVQCRQTTLVERLLLCCPILALSLPPLDVRRERAHSHPRRRERLSSQKNTSTHISAHSLPDEALSLAPTASDLALSSRQTWALHYSDSWDACDSRVVSRMTTLIGRMTWPIMLPNTHTIYPLAVSRVAPQPAGTGAAPF